jgi:hypothetical protein
LKSINITLPPVLKTKLSKYNAFLKIFEKNPTVSGLMMYRVDGGIV